MASGSYKSGEVTYSWGGDMLAFIINFTSIGIKKKMTFKTMARESTCIEDLMHHLKASNGITGKLVDKRLSSKLTLSEAGIVTNTVLEMESFTPAKRFTYNIAVKLPDGVVINVHVHSGTTIAELKHKIQDEIGMPVEEQVLEYSGRPVKHERLTVEICGHKKTPFVLKWQPCKFKLNVCLQYFNIAGSFSFFARV